MPSPKDIETVEALNTEPSNPFHVERNAFRGTQRDGYYNIEHRDSMAHTIRRGITNRTMSFKRAVTRISTIFNSQGFKVTHGIQPDGESGRKGIHPIKFLKVNWKSANRASQTVNILWPVVPAALAVRYSRPHWHLATFILNYIAMIPCANLIGFAGQELARKLHRVLGILLETTFGSVVEIVLFMVLLTRGEYRVIQAAILGSILATKLLCLGLCFFMGGLRYAEQTFSEEISEVGSDLLLTAGLGLIVPAAFYTAVRNSNMDIDPDFLAEKVLNISRITSIFLIVSYALFVFFQMRTHQSIYDAIFEADEHKNSELDLSKARLTFTECVVALTIGIITVAFIAISLVQEIPFIVEEHGISDAFVGLILVPLVEKFAEHLTAIDEAWHNTMNLALSHVLGATVQTALLTAPLTCLVGWALDRPMDLNFDLFNVVVLILAILVVGNFLRDQQSNYLEGALCIIVYINIATATFFYPNPPEP